MMKKKALAVYISEFILFLIFVSSSFDIFLNIQIMNFNLRIVYILMMLLMAIFMIKVLLGAPIKKVPGSLLILFWLFTIIIFVPNTVLLSRNIGYAAWMVINIFFVLIYAMMIEKDRLQRVLQLYLLSFVVISAAGLVQFILPVFGHPSFFVKQWWIPGLLPRINGFNYEPSFFATYMILGFSTTIYLYIKKQYLGFPNWIMLGMVLIELAVMILCSSRMGYMAIAITLIFIMAEQFLLLISRLKIQIKVLLMFILLIGLGASGFAVLLKIGGGVNRFFAGIGLGGYTSSSISIRVEAMHNTWDVIKDSPFIGVSLGGVAPRIAENKGVLVKNNLETKSFEGSNIFLEVLAATGVIGFLVFLAYLIYIFVYPSWKGFDGKWRIYSRALLLALFLELFLLAQNQNILRAYLWIHLAVISGVYVLAPKNPEKERVNEDSH